jgi:hypothetical protein
MSATLILRTLTDEHFGGSYVLVDHA